MSQRNYYWPIGILAAALTLAVLLGSLAPPALIAQEDECAIVYPDPGPDRTACDQTSTAVAVENQNSSYPSPTLTGTATAQQPAQNQVASTPTSTSTATVAATANSQPATAIPPTIPSTPTSTREAIPPTPTEDPLAGAQVIACVPGTTVEISGAARPSTPLLLFYDERPVGGGLSNGDGRFTLRLRMGQDRPGRYPLEVRERESLDLVLELACEVPATTPTPTAVR